MIYNIRENLFIQTPKGQIIKFSYKILGKNVLYPSPHRNLFLVNTEMGVKYFMSLNIGFHILKEKLFTGNLLLNKILEEHFKLPKR